MAMSLKNRPDSLTYTTLSMIQEEVAGTVIISKVCAVGVPAVLVEVGVAIPLMLADDVSYKPAPFVVVTPGYEMCLRAD